MSENLKGIERHCSGVFTVNIENIQQITLVLFI